ncbi:MAG: spermidine synthase [Candidatus Dormibacteraceae bacterium]
MVTRRGIVLLMTFCCGMSSLAIEFGAERLLAPFFGDSLYVWGVLIGMVLIYLAIGYAVGGRIADRWPRPQLFFQITAVAGFWIGLIPLVSSPILLAALGGFADLSAGVVLSTLVAVILLFAVPTIVLGFASPFAIRLLLQGVETGGNTAGRIYALSTAGSIVGTFLPVFVTIPTWGTRATLIGTGVVLIVVAAAAMFPRRWWIAVAMLAVLAMASVLLPHDIKPPVAGRLVYEAESAYNYIQVVQVGETTELTLNEAQTVHSTYNPRQALTRNEWDYPMVASAFGPRQAVPATPRRVAILGLAAGTTARELTLAYGNNVSIDGVEEDPELITVGRRYFHEIEPELHVHVADARYWLATRPASATYDLIVVDAYRQPYIPFHLTTLEFFRLVRQHLAPGGVIMVNAGRTATDYRLVAALASTMRPVFDDVFLADPPDSGNTEIYGTTRPTTLADVTHNLKIVRQPLVKQVAQEVLQLSNLRRSTYAGPVYTDDLDPIEQLTDSVIFDFATGGG